MSDNLIIDIIWLVIYAFILIAMLFYEFYDATEEDFDLGEALLFSVIITGPVIMTIAFMQRLPIFLN